MRIFLRNSLPIAVSYTHLKQVWLDTIKATVPAKFIEMNEKAFLLGYNF